MDSPVEFKWLSPSDSVKFPAKINIHFPVRGSLYHYCRDLNEKISTATANEVSFRAPSFHIPHITLYMGFVNNLAQLESVLLKTEEASFALKTFEIRPSAPYLKTPK